MEELKDTIDETRAEIIKLVSYVCALDDSNQDAWLKWGNLDDSELKSVNFEDSESVMACLALFMKYGVNLSILLCNRKAMTPYFMSVTEEQYKVGVGCVLDMGTVFDVLIFYRAVYRFGSSAIKDKEYDLLEKLYVENVPEMKILAERTYDEDDEFYSSAVTEGLRLSLPKSLGKKMTAENLRAAVGGDEIYRELEMDKSTSIRPVESVEDLFDFIQASPRCDIHFSLKIDGINTKAMFDEGGKGLLVALSRGRASNSYDYTEAIRAELKLLGVDCSKLRGKLVGESFVALEGVNALNLKYIGKNYRSPKSAGAAMLRSPQNFEPDDLRWLRTLFFNYEDRLPDVAFADLKTLGIGVPPELVVKMEEIPQELGEFSEWLDNVIIPYFVQAQRKDNLPADGIVVQLLTRIDTERNDKYSDSNVAIKFGPWSGMCYTSKVVGLEIEQRSMTASVVLLIEPVTTNDGNVATRVSGLSTAILVKDDVRIGSVISFVRKSEAYNTYIGKVG